MLSTNTKGTNYTTLILYKYFSAKNNKITFNKTTNPTFNFEFTYIHYHSDPTSYKLWNDPSKTTSLHITTSYHNKTIIWISFPNPKIGMLTREKSIHFNNIQLNETPIELIIKDIGIGKKKSYIVIVI